MDFIANTTNFDWVMEVHELDTGAISKQPLPVYARHATSSIQTDKILRPFHPNFDQYFSVVVISKGHTCTCDRGSSGMDNFHLTQERLYVLIFGQVPRVIFRTRVAKLGV